MNPSLRIVLILLLVSLIGLAVSGQSIYARLSYLWLFLITGNFFLSRLALKGIEVTRTTRIHRAQVGEIFEEVFEIRNRSRMPHWWLEVRDEGDLPGARGSRVLSLIGPKRSRSYIARTRLVARGIYKLGPTRLHSGDVFGFFPVARLIPGVTTLTVYPQVVDLYAMPHLPGMLPGGEALRRRTHQVTPNAATVREYAHGDPISRIHWPSTARRSRLIVKEFELDPLAEVWIFVDAEEKSHHRLGYTLPTDAGSVMFHQEHQRPMLPATEEYAASSAASLARHYLSVGRSVGLVAAARGLDILPADRGARQLGKIMETLALLRAVGERSFVGVTLETARFLPRGSTIILISPSTSRDFLLLVEQLRRLGLRRVVVLIDAESFGGEQGSKALAQALGGAAIPQVRISEGQLLSNSLQQLSAYSAPLVN